MAAETNTIMQNDVARVRVVDFNLQFTGSLRKFMETLGVTRKIRVQEGTTLKQLKVTGTLANGQVAEGDVIPLSKYTTEEVNAGEAKLNKWRKSTTAEAILKGGYDQAVGATTDKMLKDIQSKIRGDFFTFMADGNGTAEGAGLQAALANAWAKLSILFEDDAVETVFFVNPLDVADYLGSASIEMQTVFGMNYVENFLGLGSVFINGGVPQGTFYATAKENVIAYYIDVNAGDIANAFNLTSDESGYIGINEYADKERACVGDLVLSGVTFFPERADGVIVGTISGN